ncbi:MAG: DUF2791 family P-loop domain-containing protein [Pseudomonadales bacterium]|nr:DUF2791 family P-loop domain-containing protein [Pseudomonadales bacterium]
MELHKLTPADRESIIQPLRAGVVPMQGLELFQVGRDEEVESLKSQLTAVTNGASCCRFIVGEYGAGKTFLLQTIKSMAHKQELVTVTTDLSRTKRLSGGKSQTRAYYSALIRSMSTQATPLGQALPRVVKRFVMHSLRQANQNDRSPAAEIAERLKIFEEMACGFDFIQVIQAYWTALDTDNTALHDASLRWIRGEYLTKALAKKELGVCSIIDDNNCFDCLKMMAQFVKLSGFSGLVVLTDELGSVYNIRDKRARLNNFDAILNIVNESWLGVSPNIGYFFFTTPELFTDKKRGIQEHPALSSRLTENRFSSDTLRDWTSPVMRLTSFTDANISQLFANLLFIFCIGKHENLTLYKDDLSEVIGLLKTMLNESYYKNPRNTIKSFLDFLAIRECNPTASTADFSA